MLYFLYQYLWGYAYSPGGSIINYKIQANIFTSKPRDPGRVLIPNLISRLVRFHAGNFLNPRNRTSGDDESGNLFSSQASLGRRKGTLIAESLKKLIALGSIKRHNVHLLPYSKMPEDNLCERASFQLLFSVTDLLSSTNFANRNQSQDDELLVLLASWALNYPITGMKIVGVMSKVKALRTLPTAQSDQYCFKKVNRITKIIMK